MRQNISLLVAFWIVFLAVGEGSLAAKEDLSQHVSVEKEEVLALEKLASFDRSLSLHQLKILKETHPQEKNKLLPSEKKLFEQRQILKKKTDELKEILHLKKDLLKLPSTTSPLHLAESENIARTAIAAFYELSQNYRMIRPAVLHNALVNVGLKKEGFCWHWTRDLMQRLSALNLTTYDLHWATAHEGKIREHNTLVVSPHGLALEEGLLLDGWRKAGKPFWTRVRGDSYPWKP